MQSIYFDRNATTPVDPRVLATMLPFFSEEFGNASSFHVAGRRAAEAVEVARAHVAELIKAETKSIVFTSGATEANNLFLRGCVSFQSTQSQLTQSQFTQSQATEAQPAPTTSAHLITCKTEHPAVLDVCEKLEAEGHEVTYLSVDATGKVDPQAVQAAIRPETVLVSLMLGNNEVGTLHDIAAVGAITRAAGVVFHCDASQAGGCVPIDVDALQLDALTLTAHKMGGPKGIGALFLRRRKPRVRIEPILQGGGHEQGIRPGTLNVPAIVGFGHAAELASQEIPARKAHAFALAAEFDRLILAAFPNRIVNGHPVDRLPGNYNVTLPGISNRTLRERLPEVALSSGSACASAFQKPSHVLRAIGRSVEDSQQTLRFGFGPTNTLEEVRWTVQRMADIVAKL